MKHLQKKLERTNECNCIFLKFVHVLYRNLKVRHIIEDWFNSESKVAKFLKMGGKRYVKWVVDMTFGNPKTPNRPTQYHLRVDYYENGHQLNSGEFQSIDTTMPNRADSTFAIHRI